MHSYKLGVVSLFCKDSANRYVEMTITTRLKPLKSHHTLKAEPGGLVPARNLGKRRTLPQVHAQIR